MTYNEQSIEFTLCKPMHKLPKITELNEDQVELFLAIKLNPDILITEGLEEYNSFNLLRKRMIHIHKMEIRHDVLLLFASLVNNPAEAVMYAWYIHYLTNYIGKELTIDWLVRVEFSDGIFEKKDLHDLWYKCKTDTNKNLADHLNYGSSILNNEMTFDREDVRSLLTYKHKVTHTSFTDEEYIWINDKGILVDENDYHMKSVQEFMQYRQSPYFDTEWKIYK